MQATPCDTRAVVYGRMVLELSIRRHVAEDAVRLRQEGEAAETSDQLNRVFATVDTMRRGVELLHRRESEAAGVLSVAPAIAGELDRLDLLPRSEYLPAEKDLIYSVVEQPSSLSRISAWLRTGDFSDDECGALFGELTALHDAQQPDRPTHVGLARGEGRHSGSGDGIAGQRGGHRTLNADFRRARGT